MFECLCDEFFTYRITCKMDANNKSWNPLYYTQNLCVVKKGENAQNSRTTNAMQQNVNAMSTRNALMDTFIDSKFDTELASRFADYCNVNCSTKYLNDYISKYSDIDANDTLHTMHTMHANHTNHMNHNNQIHQIHGNSTHVSSDSHVIGGDNARIKPMQYNSLFGKSLNCGDFANLPNVDTLHTQRSPVYSFNVNANPFYSRQQNQNQMCAESADSKHYSMLPSMQTTNLSSMTSHLIANIDQSPQLTERSKYLLPFDMIPNESAKYVSNAAPVSTNSCFRPMRSIRARTVNTNSDAMNKLNYFMDRCYEQFRMLEKERKKAENELSLAFGGHKISSANNIPIQRAPQNATRIDRLLADMSREHAKVITIVAKMEHLRGSRELTESIHNVIQKWLEIIRKLQLTRKEEMITSVSNYGLVGDIFYGQVRDLVKDLSLITRAVRTAIWCALVITLSDPQHNQIY